VRPPVSAVVLTQVRKDEITIAAPAAAAMTPTVTRTERRSVPAIAPPPVVPVCRPDGTDPHRSPDALPTIGRVSHPPAAVLFLDFDGTLYVGDLPVHAYARRVAERLDAMAGLGVVAGMRRFLEDRVVPGDPGSDLAAAEDGYQAVELLAIAAGAGAELLSAAYRQSRRDLAASAFAVDAPDGLVQLLTAFHDRMQVVVVSNADPPGVAEVLADTGVAPLLDEVLLDAGKPDCWPPLIARYAELVGGADRLLAVGDRWSGDLAPIAAAGGWTALIDRFGRGDGSPDARGTDLAALLPAIAGRLAELMPAH